MGMIERVARAMCKSNGIDPDAVGYAVTPGFEPAARSNWRAFSDNARAVIAAMREPTEAMKAQGVDGIIFRMTSDRYLLPDAETGCWQAMIDAALAEPAP